MLQVNRWRHDPGQRSLRDPSQLKSLAKDDKTIRVVIETPKGSRNKNAFDQDDQVFVLKKVLPAGMAFVEELEAFFVNYHSLSSNHYTIIGVREPRAARRRLNQGRRAARQR